MNRIGLTDKNGIPFSPDRFLEEPGLAEEFLEIYDTWYYGEQDEWREFTNEQIFQFASHRLYCLEQDLQHTEYLKTRGLLQ